MENDTVTVQPLEIDYSSVVKPAAAPEEEWETPTRRYYGPKDKVTGKPMKEPPYVFTPYPSMRYAQPEGPGTRIVTRLVNSEGEDKALGPEWKSTPAAFGYIGAPSFEETLRLNQSPAQRLIDEQNAKTAAEQAQEAAAAREEQARKQAEQRAADEAALQKKIAEGVAKALAEMGIANTEKRGPGRPPKVD